MNNSFLGKIKTAWNLFRDRSPTEENQVVQGTVYSNPQHRRRLNYGNDRSIVNAIYNRIATDVSVVDMRHVRVDQNDIYVETIDSGLNRCLSLEANIDQSHQAFMVDFVMSMFDEGVGVMVPVDTNESLINFNSFDILSMRTAKVIQWHPQHVRLRVYNDILGEYVEITLPKSKVALLENPFYSVMNERLSIAKRLVDKLNLLDTIDEISGSGKLDLLMQFPFSVKSDARKEQANARKKELEDQLSNSKHGVAWVDATEKVIQLNRPVENNLMAQVEYLTRTLYSQLGISEAILNGTADEKELLNYHNRIIVPITSAIAVELKRKFLTKTAQSQGQTIKPFRDLFAMVTPERLADLTDKLTRNEVASPNDMRAVIGWKPSKAKGADELRNRNLNQPEEKPVEEPMDVTDEFKSVKKEKGE